MWPPVIEEQHVCGDRLPGAHDNAVVLLPFYREVGGKPLCSLGGPGAHGNDHRVALQVLAVHNDACRCSMGGTQGKSDPSSLPGVHRMLRAPDHLYRK